MKKIIAVLSAVVMLAVLLSGCSMLEKLNDTMRDLDGNSNIKTTSGEPTAKSTSQTSASAVPAVNTAESGVSYKYKADMKLGETTDAGTCAFKLDRLQESNFLSVLGGSAGFECSNQNALFLDGVFELTNNSGSTAKLGDIIAVQAGTETQSFSSAFFAVEKDGALKQGAELANGETAVVHCAVEVDKSLSGDITYGLVAGETYYNTIFKAGTITAPTDKKIEKGKSKYVNGSFQLDMAGALYEEKVSPGNNSYVTYNVSTEGDIFTVVKLDYSNLTKIGLAAALAGICVILMPKTILSLFISLVILPLIYFLILAYTNTLVARDISMIKKVSCRSGPFKRPLLKFTDFLTRFVKETA